MYLGQLMLYILVRYFPLNYNHDRDRKVVFLVKKSNFDARWK